MIKNKALNIKIIVKTYLKTLKIFQVSKQTFALQNIKEQFSKIVFQNDFQK